MCKALRIPSPVGLVHLPLYIERVGTIEQHCLAVCVLFASFRRSSLDWERQKRYDEKLWNYSIAVLTLYLRFCSHYITEGCAKFTFWSLSYPIPTVSIHSLSVTSHMARHVGRSRGCKSCLQRRIKVFLLVNSKTLWSCATNCPV